MTEQATAGDAGLPTRVSGDDLVTWRVIGADGTPIPAVIEADATAGTVKRIDVDADGNLVRDKDVWMVVAEVRPIVIQRIDAEPAPSEPTPQVDG